MENHDEQILSSEIERDLANVSYFLPNVVCYTFTWTNFVLLYYQLHECIQGMRNGVSGGSLTSHQEVLLKRYHEIHFDYSTEFKNTSVREILFLFISY